MAFKVYRNVREDGRGLVRVDEEESRKVRRIFELYAHQRYTIDNLMDALQAEGLTYTAAQPRFTRSKLYTILRDRSYIGELLHRGEWYPGKHPALLRAFTSEPAAISCFT